MVYPNMPTVISVSEMLMARSGTRYRAVLMRGTNQTAVMVLIGSTAAEEPARILIRERGAISNLVKGS